MRKTNAFHAMVVMLAVLLVLLAGLLPPQPRLARAQDVHTTFLPVVLSTAASHEFQPDTNGECPPNGTVDLPPLSSSLHVLPPLGENPGEMSELDRSLTDYLTVTVCAVVSGDDCTPVATFTAEKSDGGLDYIKLQDHHYHVNWKVAKDDMDRAVEIRFAVLGLEVSLVNYTPKTNRAVPVKFRIDNNPQIRARVLHEQGYTATEVAEALVDEFGLEALETAWILAIQEGYSAVEVGQALKDVFALDAPEAALILKDVGLSAVDVGWALKEVYDKDALGAAQILKDICFSPMEIGQALRDTFGLGAYDAGLVLKELGFNQYVVQGVLIEVYDTYAVIVDIQSTVNKSPLLHVLGYTGLAFCSPETRCTEPWIPDLFGQSVEPDDINKGIGGDDRYVYVKYELVAKTSTQQVVTGIEAAHWPYWDEPYPCSPGYSPVSRLTTGTWTDCYRMGMCARFQPFKDATTFVTNAAISYGDWGNPATKCSAVCGSNSNVWPLYTDNTFEDDRGVYGVDIHKGCDDEHWVYFCYNQAQAWPARPTTIEVNDDAKLAFLEQYAPRVFFDPDERFYPSSAEWSFDYLIRYSPNDLPAIIPPVEPPLWLNPYHIFPPPDGKYYVTTREIFDSPSDWFEYHHGCDGSATNKPCQLSEAPVYAFWNKQTISYAGEDIEVADLVYFFYFPYNRGKEYFDTVWGNHVGDWEKTIVRLGWVYNSNTGWQLRPLHMFVSAHDFGTAHPWDTITRVYPTQHPVVFAADGGHGIYIDNGDDGKHRYGKVEDDCGTVIAWLNDYTGYGKTWDTWNNMVSLDFDAGSGLGSSTWPRWLPDPWPNIIFKAVWLASQYSQPCAADLPACDPYDPASGPIYRWGTEEFGTCEIECRMARGPEGPLSKGIWDDPYEP